ncbi:MAG: succinyl-CoA synthetase subunit beta [Methanomassiliicoccales archaeon PtaU1.Bin124]|nr:MAG: succinyl-CoA synthetase subunit beta [Methanomassiliicoccales archaeon PtaU1.Bin124]
MDLIEHEGKKILNRFGICVPRGTLVSRGEDAKEAVRSVGLPVVLKAQVPAGGRGKAGGVQIATDLQDAKQKVENILGLSIGGFSPMGVLAEELIPVRKEFYFALTVDREVAAPIMLFGTIGGIDIEAAAGGSISRTMIDIDKGITFTDIDEIWNRVERRTGREELERFLLAAWDAFWNMDCQLLEINPLFEVDGHLIAGDAKLSIDDDALFRHPDLGSSGIPRGTDFEMACRQVKLTGVELGGDIAVVANGAGLTMAVLDEISDAGLSGSCFLDMGGTDDPAIVETAVRLASDKNLLHGLEGTFICMFGGITRCDVVAQGIINAVKEKPLDVPLVVRMRGVNEIEGREMLRAEGIEAHLDIGESIQAIKRMVG